MKTILFLCSGNYYRSRYAEIVFNSLARGAGISWVAGSAGLLPEHFAVNPGPISPTVVATALARGHAAPEESRPPRAVTAADLQGATRIIALKEAEHRHILAARFPEWADKVEYWNVHDVDVALPRVTLPLLESALARLVREMADGGPPKLKTPSLPAPFRDR